MFEVFLNPALLAGTLFVGVPIVLHLIMRQQPKRLEFPALRFIQQREHANRRRLKLRHLLLLALRCAALVLFALALARPRVSASNFLAQQEAPVAAAMVFDTSPRLLYKHQNQSRLDAARDTALWLLPQLPHESDVAVMDTSPTAPAFSIDRGAAKNRVEHLEISATGRPLASVVHEALDLVQKKSDKPRKEVYLFTDLARSPWIRESAGKIQAQLAESPETTLYVIDVGVPEPRNLSLGDLNLSNQLVPRGVPWRIDTDLHSLGIDGERSVKLYLPDAKGQLVVRSQQIVSAQSGATQPVRFTMGGLDAPGLYQGMLKLDGEDALSVDDTRYFTIEVRPASRVLLAAPPPSESYVDSLRRAVQGRFSCDVATLDDLPKRSLTDYAAVCLLDPKPLPPVAWQQLTGYVKQGGGLGIFLGRNAVPKDTFNDDAAMELLPGRLLRQVNAETWKLSLSAEDYEHPALANFKPIRSNIPWSYFPVFRYWQLDGLEPGATALMRFTDDRPALVERVVPGGRGRVLMMTTPISDPASDPKPWNILPTGFEPWPFVMLANETLYYLVGSERLNYAAGEIAELRLTGAEPPSSVVLFTPRGDQIPRAPDLKQGIVTITSTDQPGSYQLRGGGETGMHRGFSVNLRAEATNLERLSEQEIKDRFGEERVHLAHSRDEIVRDLSTGRVGWELYPPLIVLVALVLAAEHFIASRFYRQRVQPDAVSRVKPVAEMPTSEPARFVQT